MINLFQPSLGLEELKGLEKIFNSNWIGKGDEVKKFEENFAKSLKCDVSHFLSTTSCTEAIFLSSKIFSFSSKDEVIIPSISFPSIGSAVFESGAKIIFSDVDQRSLNVRAEDLEHLITKRTKAVFVTHYGGVPCDMDDILELCKSHNIKLIEDSACAVRSFYKDRACGTMGDFGMWSFDAMKTLTTGDGGMIYISDNQNRIMAEELLYLGLPKKTKSGLDSSSDGNKSWWEFEMNSPGRRAIMNNISASIGNHQLEKLGSFILRRKEIFEYYYSELKDVGDICLPPIVDFKHESSYYFFWIQTKSRDNLAKFLIDNEIYTTFRYWPLHKVNFFKKFSINNYPNSDFASKFTLNLPLHQGLSDGDISKVVENIRKFYGRN